MRNNHPNVSHEICLERWVMWDLAIPQYLFGLGWEEGRMTRAQPQTSIEKVIFWLFKKKHYAQRWYDIDWLICIDVTGIIAQRYKQIIWGVIYISCILFKYDYTIGYLSGIKQLQLLC